MRCRRAVTSGLVGSVTSHSDNTHRFVSGCPRCRPRETQSRLPGCSIGTPVALDEPSRRGKPIVGSLSESFSSFTRARESAASTTSAGCPSASGKNRFDDGRSRSQSA
ncbi:hypothetical protein D8S78_00255 [Natrialba swarupiae]|nr:hypothetical protein [Natrialba swarupiae]